MKSTGKNIKLKTAFAEWETTKKFTEKFKELPDKCSGIQIKKNPNDQKLHVAQLSEHKFIKKCYPVA